MTDDMDDPAGEVMGSWKRHLNAERVVRRAMGRGNTSNTEYNELNYLCKQLEKARKVCSDYLLLKRRLQRLN